MNWASFSHSQILTSTLPFTGITDLKDAKPFTNDFCQCLLYSARHLQHFDCCLYELFAVKQATKNHFLTSHGTLVISFLSVLSELFFFLKFCVLHGVICFLLEGIPWQCGMFKNHIFSMPLKNKFHHYLFQLFLCRILLRILNSVSVSRAM